MNSSRDEQQLFSIVFAFRALLYSKTQMSRKRKAVTKGIPTLFALTGFFSSVDLIMPDKSRVVGRGLSTFPALIGLLASVNPRVVHEM